MSVSQPDHPLFGIQELRYQVSPIGTTRRHALHCPSRTMRPA
jgi:hypothetical protein